MHELVEGYYIPLAHAELGLEWSNMIPKVTSQLISGQDAPGTQDFWFHSWSFVTHAVEDKGVTPIRAAIFISTWAEGVEI